MKKKKNNSWHPEGDLPFSNHCKMTHRTLLQLLVTHRLTFFLLTKCLLK